MANHATVTPTSSVLPPPQPAARDDRPNRLLVFRRSSPSEMEQSEQTSTTRLPPVVPMRHGPGAAVRMAPTFTSSTQQRAPLSPAPSLPQRNILLNRQVPAVGNIEVTNTEAEVISLSQPRPDGERVRNEYIDTPLKGGLSGRVGTLSSTPLHAETHIHISGSPHDHLALVSPLGSSGQHQGTSSSSKSLPFHCTPSTSPALKRLQGTRRSLPITKQPLNSVPYTKDTCSSSQTFRSAPSFHSQQPPSTTAVSLVHPDTSCVSGSRITASSSTSSRVGDSIICPDCSRCRCQSCRTPRALPSKWLCGDKCLCSAESCVDYVSCLCCVKGLFYHCGSTSDDEDDEEEEESCQEEAGYHRRSHHRHHHSHHDSTRCHQRRSGSCADDPCSCVPSHHRLARWGCLASLSLILPCLLCYWPLQGGVKVVELCYQRCTRHGCRCDEQKQQHRITTSDHHHSATSSGQQQMTSLNTSSKAIIASQPLPSSGKRLLDI